MISQLGWFLAKTPEGFAKICVSRNEPERAEKYLVHAELLRTNLEKKGLDGNWYPRSFSDDGTLLGSKL